MLQTRINEILNIDTTDYLNLTDAEVFDNAVGKFLFNVKLLSEFASPSHNWTEEELEAWREKLDYEYTTLIHQEPSLDSKVRLIRELEPVFQSGTWIGNIDLDVDTENLEVSDLLGLFDLKREDNISEYDFKHQAAGANCILHLLKISKPERRLSACALKRKHRLAIKQSISKGIFSGSLEYGSAKLSWKLNLDLYVYTPDVEDGVLKVDWEYIDEDSQSRIIDRILTYPFKWGSFLTKVGGSHE